MQCSTQIANPGCTMQHRLRAPAHAPADADSCASPKAVRVLFTCNSSSLRRGRRDEEKEEWKGRGRK
jgi:hypothetical protein